MAEQTITLENRILRLRGNFSEKTVFLKNARVEEGLSQLTAARVEFLCSDHEIDLQSFLGGVMTLEMDVEDDTRYFAGHCISVEHIGLYQGLMHLVAELRPWPWFLTRTTDQRIFQDKTVKDIIADILSELGFSSDYENKLTASYQKRPYTVQYRETDFAFLSRLMEEEGIYYFFKYQSGAAKLVLVDSISGHMAIEDPVLEYHHKEEGYRRHDDHIFDWADGLGITSGKVTIDDYDFTKPGSDLKAVKAIEKGKHNHRKYELYDYPGRNRIKDTGDARARVKMEAEAVRHMTSQAVGNARFLESGGTFRLKGHRRVPDNSEFMITSAVHLMQIETDYEDRETLNNPFNTGNSVDFQDNPDTYRCQFTVIPKSEPFRAPLDTPRPEIAGLQTAVVTGPSGEEIHTDAYGRIKVQFHWDREGKKDEKTTCWVRVAHPWTGKTWGMFAIPRIGQEVIIQFEEGDPDRPICTGMLYNEATKPPYAFPEHQTQTGIVTRSTKGGSAATFNELVFEDKKDKEFVRLQSERDYKQTIKNNATVTIGLEHKDKGDLTQTIHRNKTETLKTGDHSLTVETGAQTIFVKKDLTETVEGAAVQTITKNTSQTILSGHYTQDVKQGNVTRTLGMGSEAVTLKMGNFTLTSSLGRISLEAMQAIELKVGTSSVVIDQTGVKIKGLLLQLDGTGMLTAKAPSTTVSGNGLLTLKGGLTMIN